MLEFSEKIRAPEFRVEQWLNVDQPLTLLDLRGKVVLVDFWDYTCVNCLHTLPYLQEWHRRYAQYGLVIVGIHAPEFSFSKEAPYIQEAVARLRIEYPVALDNDFRTWQAYANRGWPTKYLVDPQGYVRASHTGEGAYGEMEQVIQRLLLERDPSLQLPELMSPVRAMDVPGNLCYRVTPELYLGYCRSRLGNEQTATREIPYEYKLPSCMEDELVYLCGAWLHTEEYVESKGDSTPELTYAAAEVNLVLHSNSEQPVCVYLEQDGQPLPRSHWGEDVQLDASGKPTVQVYEPRMYAVIKNPGFEHHALKIWLNSSGLRAYALTFVSCVSEETAIA